MVAGKSPRSRAYEECFWVKISPSSNFSFLMGLSIEIKLSSVGQSVLKCLKCDL